MGATPGIGTEKTAVSRKILLSREGALFLPRGKVVPGAEARDAFNTGYLDTLRAGMVLGKRQNDGKYAPSILGHLTVAGTAAGATITVDLAVAVELNRRVGIGNLFKVVGPPTDGGTVAVLNTLSYSGAVETTGVITLAANNAVAEVQNINLGAVATAGTFTFTYKGETTAAIAFDATVAQVKAALELLSTVAVDDITPEAVHEIDTEVESDYTFANTLGNVPMLTMDTSLLTGPTQNVGTEVTPGELVGAATLGADACIGSVLMPADGSEAPLGLLNKETGIKVTDKDGVDIDVELAQLCIAGIIDASQIVEYPNLEQGVRTWLKAQLNTYGYFIFDDNF